MACPRFQRLRNTLREYFPAALGTYADLELTSTDALKLLIKAPSPRTAARLTRPQITAVLARHRRHNRTAKAATIQTMLREQHLGLPEPVKAAYAATAATAHAKLLIALNEQIAELEAQVKAHFLAHPDAEIYLSMPGIGVITGAGCSPSSETTPPATARRPARTTPAPAPSPGPPARCAVPSRPARYVRSNRLADALQRQAFSALNALPGARHYCDKQRPRGRL